MASARIAREESQGASPPTDCAGEIRTKLLAWKQTPEPQRVSLRALATQIGTSHQLFSFHLRRLDKWQMEEYQKKAREIRDRAIAENRHLTQEEQMRCDSYSRTSLDSMIDSAICEMLSELRKRIKHGTLSGQFARVASLLGRKGYREAQEILDLHFAKNNLPRSMTRRAKPFKTEDDGVGNSVGPPRAFT